MAMQGIKREIKPNERPKERPNRKIACYAAIWLDNNDRLLDPLRDHEEVNRGIVTLAAWRGKADWVGAA
jgi:hypothetical protein